MEGIVGAITAVVNEILRHALIQKEKERKKEENNSKYSAIEKNDIEGM